MAGNTANDEDDEPTFGELAGLGLRLAEGGDSIPGAIMFAAFGLGLAGVAYGCYQVKKQVDKRKARKASF